MASPPDDYPVPPYDGAGANADVPAWLDKLGLWTAKRLPRRVDTIILRDAIPAADRYIGLVVVVESTSKEYQWDGTAWTLLSTIDHGSLTGLTDDDHPQYVLVDSYKPARIITKETSEALSNSSVFQNDDDLFFTVEANRAYRIALDLGYMAGVTGRLRLTWASSTAQVPGGRWGGVGDVGSTLTNRQFNEALTLNGVGPQTQKHAVITGLFRVTVAGTIRLQWSQLVADAEATTVLQHSCLTVWEK